MELSVFVKKMCCSATFCVKYPIQAGVCDCEGNSDGNGW